MIKAAVLTVLAAFVLTVAGVSFAQTTDTTTSPSPTGTMMQDAGTNDDRNNYPVEGQGGSGANNNWMPSGAPTTGFGGAQ